MVQYSTVIKRFAAQGEKTGWTYILIPQEIAAQLVPGNRKGFRIKGRIDKHPFEMLALIPMGGGDFILPLNAALRKAIGKSLGAEITIKMQVDHQELLPPPELMECLEDEPEALAYFNSLPKGHQNYYSNWIRAAKTEATKAKRIAAALNAFINKWDYGQMIRAMKKDRIDR